MIIPRLSHELSTEMVGNFELSFTATLIYTEHR
jgi:hypothetical protein